MQFELGLHQSLGQPSTAWDFATDAAADKLELDMIRCMVHNRGIGLAANQIGLTKRVFVMGSYNISKFPQPFAVFNPVILSASQEYKLDKEGCLSYPDLFLQIKRPISIHVAFQNSKGDMFESQLDGYLAKCFQHELDHLNGVCFVDRISKLKLQFAMKKLRKIK